MRRLYSGSTSISITDPLVLYRSLIDTRRLEPDPAQYRLAIHLQKLYRRLKDYRPEEDYSHRLKQLSDVLGQAPSNSNSKDATIESSHHESSFWSSLRHKQPDQNTNALTKRLTNHDAAIHLHSPQGLILHGDVGTGKSLLIDLLASSLPSDQKRRWHFNTFMLEIFTKLEQARIRRATSMLQSQSSTSEEHSLLCLARELILTSPIMFLDEFQLPDRAASKILPNLLTSFFQLGGVLIATSNRMPDDLIRASGKEFPAPVPRRRSLFNGLGDHSGHPGRDRAAPSSEQSDFAQFLEVLRARCEVWHIEGVKDWRRWDCNEAEHEPVGEQEKCPSIEMSKSLSSASDNKQIDMALPNATTDTRDETESIVAKPPFRYLVKDHMVLTKTSGHETDDQWKEIESRLMAEENVKSPNTGDHQSSWRSDKIYVFRREVHIPARFGGVSKWKFAQICGASLGSADYISLASTFHTLMLDEIPVLTLLHKSEARRFITLLDALYEAKCKLAVRAACGPDELFFPETRAIVSEGNLDKANTGQAGDEVYAETFAEIYQDQTSPFRPNVSAYTDSASKPSYAGTAVPTLASRESSRRSMLADEDSDFGPIAHTESQRSGPISSPDFTHVGTYTGEDERFAYLRASSRLWEMCGQRWWAREGDWWRPLSREARHWQIDHVEADNAADIAMIKQPMSSKQSTSPFRRSEVEPPKLSWTHVWGMMTWGKKAGPWGQGPAGLQDREKPDSKQEK